MLEMNKIYRGDCLEVMKDIDDESIDMILCDLPYKTTNCKWDVIIDLDLLWEQYKRVIKERGAIVLTSTFPFTNKLINYSSVKFRYDLIWDKNSTAGFLHANKMPLRAHEHILVFYKKLPIYNPQKTKGKPYKTKKGSCTEIYKNKKKVVTENKTGERFPKSIIKIKKQNKPEHPTQKPVALFEYLIKTYTNENDLVLDNCIGSGTTAIAAINTNRHYIGIEKEKKYFDIAVNRIKENNL